MKDRNATFEELQSKGLMLVVLGPDGVGKSTVINALEEGLKPLFGEYRYFHLRPRFRSPIDARSYAPVNEPHGKAGRSLPASWLKIIYYVADYVSGYWLKLRKLLGSSTLIIFDRYYQDLLVDPRRFRLRGSSWLVKLLMPLIPKPTLYLVLDAEPEAIHARKAELPVEEIKRQREIFRKFAESERCAVLLSTDGDERSTVDRALNLVHEAIESRKA